MSPPILTRWPVVIELEASPSDFGGDGRFTDDAVDRWFEEARSVYVDRCPALAEASSRGEIRATRLRVTVSAAAAVPRSVLVAVSVVEVAPTSLTMSCRIRSLAEGGEILANGRWRVELIDPRSAQAAKIPDRLRRELIALEQGARDYC